MVEQIVALCRQLGVGEDQDALLQPLALAAFEQLRLSLREGVCPEDCGEVFPLAAAMVAVGALREMTGEDAVTAFTAGEVTIRRARSVALSRAARALLSPWTADGGFCMKEVRG